jgi:hypothetical protein
MFDADWLFGQMSAFFRLNGHIKHILVMARATLWLKTLVACTT